MIDNVMQGCHAISKYHVFYGFFFLRYSISRKPIRSKSGRQSSMSMYSVTTVSSEEGTNIKDGGAISQVPLQTSVEKSVQPLSPPAMNNEGSIDL